MRTVLIVVGTLTLISPAAAEEAAPFCQSGFDILLKRSGPIDADVVFRNCPPGNAIVIPNANSISMPGAIILAI